MFAAFSWLRTAKTPHSSWNLSSMPGGKCTAGNSAWSFKETDALMCLGCPGGRGVDGQITLVGADCLIGLAQQLERFRSIEQGWSVGAIDPEGAVTHCDGMLKTRCVTDRDEPASEVTSVAGVVRLPLGR